VGTRRISAVPRLRYEGNTKPNSTAARSSGIASKNQAGAADTSGALAPRGDAGTAAESGSSFAKPMHFPGRRAPASRRLENLHGIGRLEHARAARRRRASAERSLESACGMTPDTADVGSRSPGTRLPVSVEVARVEYCSISGCQKKHDYMDL